MSRREVAFELALAAAMGCMAAPVVWLAGLCWNISSFDAAALGSVIGVVFSILVRTLLGGVR